MMTWSPQHHKFQTDLMPMSCKTYTRCWESYFTCTSLELDRYRYRVSADTRQYWSVSVSAPIPVVLSFVYLSQQSTLLQRTPIAYTIFLCNIPHIHITCTQIHPAQNRIFSTKKFVQPGIGIAAANSIGYRAPARYQSNPILFLVSQFRHQ